MAFIDYLRRFFTFFRFKHSVVLVTSIALSVLFWLYAPLVAFNDIYIASLVLAHELAC
ncbi:hypothetical protein [Campylobacter concisus]|uniref:hypothetical protein n=1 Tax=Campylobacter concisus TaxID=199 RepID=UPI0015D6BDA0|nr:hypothetical protein [Campylobacter concisus]